MTTSNDTQPKLNVDGADSALKITKILKKLITCLTQETLALQGHNRDIAAKMAQEKTILMHNYKTLQNNVLENPETLKNLDPDVRAHLKEVTKEFEVALKDNVVAIYSGRNAVSRLINRIIKKARDSVSTTPKSYNASGCMVNNDTKASMMPTKLNETH